MPTSALSDYRHMRTGSLNIPPPQKSPSNGMMGPMQGPHRFDGPRSPPYHDIGAAAENICKYFAKGNCKFGPKCANIHVLPDGRRINYGKNGVTIGVSPINLGSRVNPSTYHHPSNSALTNSFMRDETVGTPYTSTAPYAIPTDERYTHRLGRQASVENGLPIIDTTYSSNPASAYGSPRDDEASRLGLGLSPAAKGLSVLDAPLPASFDSNGISHAARYGPWPASVPSKFGLESPSPSLNNARDSRTSETLKLLHTSAFGSSEHLSSSSFAGTSGDLNSLAMGTSPSGPAALHSGAGEEYGKRVLHSSSLRYAKPRLLSSSVPKIDRDWEPEFMFEEDYVPGALANEVLTPAEKARRGSTTMSSPLRVPEPATDSASESGVKTGSSAGGTKFGSPAAAHSPSRWSTLFQRQREDELLEAGNGSLGTSGSRAMKHAAPSFTHVGSPLRNSSLASGIGDELDGDPSRLDSASRLGAEPLSALTQQLQRTRFGDDVSSVGSSPRPLSSSTRMPGTGGGQSSLAAGVIGRERERDKGLERHAKSGSMGSSAASRSAAPIDEEDPTVFSMEEEDEAHMRARQRASGGLGSAGWSFATVAGKTSGPSAIGGNENTRHGSATVETR